MENLSRGPTFGDFVTILTEGRCRTSRLQDYRYRVQEYRLPSPPLLNVMYFTASESFWGQSKYSLRITKEKGVMVNLFIYLSKPYKTISDRWFGWPYLSGCHRAALRRRQSRPRPCTTWRWFPRSWWGRDWACWWWCRPPSRLLH